MIPQAGIGKVDKFAIVATFEVAEGRMDEFLPLLLAHPRPVPHRTSRALLRFDVLRPRNEENTIMLYEVHEHDAAFQVPLEWAIRCANARLTPTGMVASYRYSMRASRLTGPTHRVPTSTEDAADAKGDG